MKAERPTLCSSVYGPTQSWRFGRSLGIDPIGSVSTCPFNCVYCQLGAIQHQTLRRRVYIPTRQITNELLAIIPLKTFDVITLSGSGEPTLAENLEDILVTTKEVTNCPRVVLTNGVLLQHSAVRHALQQADIVAVKIDAITAKQWQRVNRPVAGIGLSELLKGLQHFSQEYSGHLAIQTMLLTLWSSVEQNAYIQLLQQLGPDEVQLNIPRRSPAATRQIDARGNEVSQQVQTRPRLKCLDSEALKEFCLKIHRETGIRARSPSSESL